MSTMSDLAPFVAAVLRDDVIHDLLEDINRLNLQVGQLEETVANSQTLMITNRGVAPDMGRRDDEMNDDNNDAGGVADENRQDEPVITYATAQIDRDGEAQAHWDEDRENSVWMVVMAMEPGVSCHYSQLNKLALNLGGTIKSFIQRAPAEEDVDFHDYIDISHTLELTISIWVLNVEVIATLRPISPAVAQQLRARGGFRLSGLEELRHYLDEQVENDEERQNITLEFQQVKFNYQSHTLWHMT